MFQFLNKKNTQALGLLIIMLIAVVSCDREANPVEPTVPKSTAEISAVIANDKNFVEYYSLILRFNKEIAEQIHTNMSAMSDQQREDYVRLITAMQQEIQQGEDEKENLKKLLQTIGFENMTTSIAVYDQIKESGKIYHSTYNAYIAALSEEEKIHLFDNIKNQPGIKTVSATFNPAFVADLNNGRVMGCRDNCYNQFVRNWQTCSTVAAACVMECPICAPVCGAIAAGCLAAAELQYYTRCLPSCN
jgi:hypothetical protein